MDSRKAAYGRLEEAIRGVVAAEQYSGVLTEWVVVLGTRSFDEDGDSVSQVGRLVPGGGGTLAHHHVMGLLDFALTQARADVVEEAES